MPSPSSGGTARCRCRRTSPSRWPSPSATRPCTPIDRARWRRPPPGSTSRRSVLDGLPSAGHRAGDGRAGRRARHVQAGGRRRSGRPPDAPRALPGAARRCWPRAAPPVPAGGRVVAVGTTSVRALESAAAGELTGRHRPVHPPALPVAGRRRAAHQLPPAPHDAAHARRRVRRAPLARPLRRRAGRRVPLPVVRRRHAARRDPTADGARRAGRRGHRGRGPGRDGHHRPRQLPHAVLHAGRDAGRDQAPVGRRLRAARCRDRAGQHVPPDAAARRRHRRRPRRPARLHRLGRPRS